MIRLFLILFLAFSCKLQTDNSSTSDGLSGGSECESSLNSAETRFCYARNVIVDKCVSCHTGYHSTYYNFTEKDFADEGLIVAGDSENSSLVSILLNNGGSMPKGGEPLKVDEVTYLNEWINLYTGP